MSSNNAAQYRLREWRNVTAIGIALAVTGCSQTTQICFVRLSEIQQSYKVVSPPPFPLSRIEERSVALRLIRERRYAEAAPHYFDASGYSDKTSDPGHPYEFFFRNDFRNGFYALIQDYSCGSPKSFWNPAIRDSGAGDALLQAWVAAANNDASDATALARRALTTDSNFIYAETTLGLICKAEGRASCARGWWLKAAANPGYPMPDEVIPDDQQYPFELLLHFSP